MLLPTVLVLSSVDSLARISSGGRQCEIVQQVVDDESGNPLEVRCENGSYVKSLGHALKGVDIDKVSTCSVNVMIYAVHVPKLLNVSNCSDGLVVYDIGQHWLNAIEQRSGITPSRVEYVAYEKVKSPGSCYKVSLTYDKILNSIDTSFLEKVAKYCLSK